MFEKMEDMDRVKNQIEQAKGELEDNIPMRIGGYMRFGAIETR